MEDVWLDNTNGLTGQKREVRKEKVPYLLSAGGESYDCSAPKICKGRHPIFFVLGYLQRNLETDM